MAGKVYISGPYSYQAPGVVASKEQRSEFKARTKAIAAKLSEAGFEPFYPQMLYESWNGAFRGFSETWPWPDGGHSSDRSMNWLWGSVAVVQVPGYSPGGQAEIALAENLGIPIYQHDDIDSLIAGYS